MGVLTLVPGIAMLGYLRDRPEVYDILEARAAQLFASAPAGLTVNRVGAMFTLFFTDQPVTDYASAKTSDTQRFARYFHHMMDGGVYLAPSQFEAGFVSTAHSEADIKHTVDRSAEFFANESR
jgi:glutamate-1-semialdehyde 2,1-aminomutase